MGKAPLVEERRCGSCGQSRNMTREQRLITFGPQPGINGVIELLKWEGCNRPYTGPRRHEDIYLCGLGTEHERLFDTHSDREAREYVKSFEPRLTLSRHTATQMCDAALRELFGEG